LSIQEVPTPKPAANEVKVKIHAAGVNPVDWKIADGLLSSKMECEWPITLGWDFAGTISEVGSAVSTFSKGDPVYGYARKEKLHDGTFAEYLCMDANNVSRKPASLSMEEAASIPLSALTAWQAMFDKAQLKKGETALIYAGAGGVGSYAVQLAKLYGAYVIATGSGKNHNYINMLGADEVIDYTAENVAKTLLKRYPNKLDFIFDTIGGKTLEESYSLVKPGGWLVTIAGVINAEHATQHKIQAEWIFVKPDKRELDAITKLIDEKKLKCPKIETYPFKEVGRALKKNKQGHVQGKLVVLIYS
ncbi:MAG: NADP-dependent oxidoreductase, partial [Chlamydiales bacterium]